MSTDDHVAEPTPAALRAASRVTTTLAYVSAMVGIVAGGVLLGDGRAALGVAVWLLTFAWGAMLATIGLVAHSHAVLLRRSARIEMELTDLVHRRQA